MCEHERDNASNLDQLDYIKALITPLKLSISGRYTLEALQDTIAWTNIDLTADLIADILVTRLTTYVSAMQSEKFCHYTEYPENWWEAFKLRFFPKFLIDRYPIKYTVIDISIDRYVVCPHVPVLDKHKHYMWMLDTIREVN